MQSYKLRVAIWAAVSTDEQALHDKGSISMQVDACKKMAENFGAEIVGVFIADGYSRTAYYNLADAMYDIPPLKDCIEAIHTYDVLIVKNFDRLGSLGMLVYYYFNQYRKQLYSVQQATQIQDPETYNPASDISVPSMIISASQNQVYRIAKITDAFSTGVKKRVADGYYARRLPYGYVNVDEKNVAIVPHIAGLLAKFPEWYLGGLSTLAIVQKANESGVPTRSGQPWTQHVVIYILKSPFYAGKVYFARGRRDKANGKHIFFKDPELIDGKHEALWSYETHLRILDEFERRRNNKQLAHVYNLSSVLKCSICGHSLLVTYDKTKTYKHGKNKSTTRLYWRCPGHVSIKKADAESQIIAGLIALFSSDAPVPNPEGTGAPNFTDRELSALHRQMTRLEQAYESGAYTVEEFTAKRKAYKAREVELLDTERQKAEVERHKSEQAELVLKMRDLIFGLPEWVTNGDPAEVRYHLLRVVKVTAYPDKRVTVELL